MDGRIIIITLVATPKKQIIKIKILLLLLLLLVMVVMRDVK